MLCSIQISAQQKVKVLTKTIHKEIEYKGQGLEVIGEKSTITLIGNESNLIKIEIKLISKNISESDARKDLNIIKYDIKELRSADILSNHFESDEYKDITSNLSVVYNIYVPYKCQVNLTNIYGNIYVSQLNSSLNVKSSFGEMKMENITGKIDLDLKYVNLNADKINTKMICIADKTDMYFKETTGNIDIRANYGEINIDSPSKENNINIDAARTEVSLVLPEYMEYNYRLITKSSDIFVPKELKGSNKTDKQLKTFNLQKADKINQIKISTTYSPITIKSF